MSLKFLIREINNRSKSHPIGKLQEIRREIKRLSRRPGTDIFHPQSTFEEYAFHWGGRAELQFNVGYEDEARREFRHGVAFCFDPGQTLPDPSVLIPKVPRFNEFLHDHPHVFSDLRMWRWIDGAPTPHSRPAAIEATRHELLEGRPFIFLGRTQKATKIDYEMILADLDSLLLLYEFVEGTASTVNLESELEATGFNFSPGKGTKTAGTTATISAQQRRVALRENKLQSGLRDYLASQHGPENVSREQIISTLRGRLYRADVMVRRAHRYWLYEVKARASDRECIRDALGQLLEYSFWPGNQGASRLFVVGEAALSADGAQYLTLLRRTFHIPVEYRQFDLAEKRFVGKEA